MQKIQYDGFFLSFIEGKDVNDKDITVQLYLMDNPNRELGTFTFNKSQKYGSKCFFTFSTKSLYQTANLVYEGEGKNAKYNYFTYPFYAFRELGLLFNNVTSMEVACDTEASVIGRIQYALGKPEVFDMVLLWKKVENPHEILDGYWEYYQRSRLRSMKPVTTRASKFMIRQGNSPSLVQIRKF